MGGCRIARCRLNDAVKPDSGELCRYRGNPPACDCRIGDDCLCGCTHSHADRNSYANADPYADAYSHSDGNRHTDPDTNARTYGNGDLYAHRYADIGPCINRTPLSTCDLVKVDEIAFTLLLWSSTCTISSEPGDYTSHA